jgi:hypothetical protein
VTGGTVPLSEHEQRQLEQIEQALYADYPRFASAVRASDPRVHYRRRIIAAAICFLLGAGLLVTGVVLRIMPGIVAGFVVMVICSMWAVGSYRHLAAFASVRRPMAGRRPRRNRDRARAGGHPARPARPSGAGMMERLEERWRRRQERDR